MGTWSNEFRRELLDGTITPLTYLLSHSKRVRIGQRFGYLTVVGAPFYLRDDWGTKRRTHVVCSCDCGVLTVVSAERLASGRRVACGECRYGEPRDPEAEPAPDPSAVTLKQLSEQYVQTHMITATSGTVARFKRTFARLFCHYGRDIAVGELTNELIGGHFRWLMEDQKLKASSVNSSHRAYLLSVWRYAVDLGMLDRMPRIQKLTELRHEPDSWTVDEVRRLVEATAIFRGTEWPSPIPHDHFWRALLLVCYWTALRLGALLKLRLADVNLSTGWVYVQPHAAKNRHGKKVRIGDDAIAAVRAIQSPPRELLFPWPIAEETIFRQFRQIQVAAGLPNSPLKLQRFHKLRRTTATHAAIHAGMAAAIALLDHSGPEITKRYLDPSKMPGCDATQFLPTLNITLADSAKTDGGDCDDCNN